MAPIPSLRKYAVLVAAIALPIANACGQAAPATPAPTPVTPNSFADVTAQLDPGGEFYLYLSTAQWLGKLSDSVNSLHDIVLSSGTGFTPERVAKADKAAAVARDMIQKSGLQDISGIGASSFNYTPGLYRNKIFVHHYPAEGSGLIWSLYGRSPHALDALDMLPVDTSAAGFGDFDLAHLINFLISEANQSGIPEFKQAVDQMQTQFFGVSGLKLDDVLASLSGSMGTVVTQDASDIISIPINQQVQTMPAPHLAILIAVKNDLIFDQVDKMITGNPGVIKTEEPGLRMRTMPVPFIMPTLNLRPSVAQWNGFLVIATDDAIIRKIIAAKKDGHGIKETPEYARLSAGLPQQGNSFAVMTQLFTDTLQKFQSGLTANQPGTPPAQAAQLQKLIHQYQHTGPMMSVGAVLPTGWLSVSQGSQGSSQLLAPLIIAPAAIAAGVVMPMMMHHTQPPPAFPPPTSSGPGATNPYLSPNPGTSP